MSKVNEKTVTQKIAELGELVAWFESDEFELEQAITKYKEAEKLADEVEHDLSALKNEVTVLKQKFDA
jgi:exodeoxyribonuclease VII small subunit